MTRVGIHRCSAAKPTRPNVTHGPEGRERERRPRSSTRRGPSCRATPSCRSWSRRCRSRERTRRRSRSDGGCVNASCLHSRPVGRPRAADRRLTPSSQRERGAGEDRESPPEVEADEDRDEQRRERGADTQQRVEHEDRRVDRGGVERGSERVERGDREAEADAEARPSHTGAAGTRHLRRAATIALMTSRVIAITLASSRPGRSGGVPDASRQGRAENRRRDRGDRLGNEHRAVGAARQVVLGRAGEDRARGGEGHERDALRDRGELGRRALRYETP